MRTQPQYRKTNQDPIDILQLLLLNETSFYHFYIETEYFKMCRIMLNILEILCFLHVTQILFSLKLAIHCPGAGKKYIKYIKHLWSLH